MLFSGKMFDLKDLKWADLRPLVQDDGTKIIQLKLSIYLKSSLVTQTLTILHAGPTPLCPIAYQEDYKNNMNYLRALMKKKGKAVGESVEEEVT